MGSNGKDRRKENHTDRHAKLPCLLISPPPLGEKTDKKHKEFRSSFG